MAALAGGRDKLFEAAQAALDQGDAQWASRLADSLLALDSSQQHRNLKADALTVLAENTINAPSRNYYLAYAQSLRGGD